MRRKILVMAPAILFLIMVVIPFIGAASSIITVTPASTSVTVGDEFTVNVTLDQATNLYGFEFWLSFDKTKLNAIAVDYQGYLNTPTKEWNKEINNASGYVTLAMSSQLPATWKTGGSPPPLVIIRFKTIAAGTSNLHLYNTILTDNSMVDITHTSSDGTVTIASAAPPVGGTWIPIDKLAIMAPWIILVSAIIASAVTFGLLRRHRNKQII